MHDAVIVAAVRTPVGKAPRGAQTRSVSSSCRSPTRGLTVLPPQAPAGRRPPGPTLFVTKRGGFGRPPTNGVRGQRRSPSEFPERDTIAEQRCALPR